MKKNTILKVLSFVLLLTFVFSAVLMTGCNDQMKEDIAKNQTDLEAANAELKSAKEEIAKLQTALNELKEASATSDALSQQAAALQAKINESKAALDELTTALANQGTESGTKIAELETEIQANADEIATLTAALETQKTESANQIAATKAALEEKIRANAAEIADLQAALDAKATEVATELANAKAALEAKIKDNADGIEELTTAIETMEAETAAEIAALEEALEAKIQANTAEIATLTAALEAQKTDSAAQIAALEAKIQANTANIETLTTALEAQKTAAAAELANAKAALEAEIQEKATEIAGLTEALATANTALETAKADLSTAIKAVSDGVAALDETYATDAELAAAKEAAAKDLRDAIAALADVYATKSALSDAVAGIQETIDALGETYATDEELAAAIAELQAPMAALDDTFATDEELAGLSEELNELITALQTTDTDLDTAIKAVDAAVKALETLHGEDKAELLAAIDAIYDVINALDDTYATDVALADAVAALEAKIAALGTDDEALAKAVADLNAAIADRLVKSDWIAATDVLFDDDDPRSIASFKAGIVRVYIMDKETGKPLDEDEDNVPDERDPRAIPYEDRDIIAYALKADLLADKLLRAISLDDIDATFALRDEMFARLIPIVDKFEAELVKWEPEENEDGTYTGKLGFPSVVGDQLARLKELHGLIEERELYITQAQENRYQALLDAQERLLRAEGVDKEIYDGNGIPLDFVTQNVIDPETGEPVIDPETGEPLQEVVTQIVIDPETGEPVIDPETGEPLREEVEIEHETQLTLGLGINDVVLYLNQTATNLETIEGLYIEYVAPLFENPVETKYYAVGMSDLPYYTNYTNKLGRYEELKRAEAAFVQLYPNLTWFKDFQSYDPLLDDYNNIEGDDGAELDAWKALYKLQDVKTLIMTDADNGNVIYVYDQELERDVPLTKTVDKELENCFLIIDKVDGEKGGYLGGYARILAIRYFVRELKALETKYINPNVVGTNRNLVDQIRMEVNVDDAARKVLWTRIATYDDIFARQKAIYDAIDALRFELYENRFIMDDNYATRAWESGYAFAVASRDYDKKDVCKKDILQLTLESNAVLEAIHERVNTLHSAKDAIDALVQALYDQYYDAESNSWNVTFADSKYITKTLPAYLESIFSSRGISMSDELRDINTTNYYAMTGEIRLVQAYLNTALDNLIAVIQAIYDNVKDDLKKPTNYLPDLNKILVAQSMVYRIQAGVAVDDTDFDLDDEIEVTDPVTGLKKMQAIKIPYSTIFNQITTKAITLVRVAEEADQVAVAINNKIKALGEFNLNKTVVVDETTAMVIDWSERYLGIEFDYAGLHTDPRKAPTPEEKQTYLEKIAKYFTETEVEQYTIEFPILYVNEYGIQVVSLTETVKYEINRVAKDDAGKANEGILGIGLYNAGVTPYLFEGAETYIFISDVYGNMDVFNTLKATHATRIAKYNAAEAEYQYGEAFMKPAANREAIDTAFNAFINYTKKYYTNIVTQADEGNAIAKYYGITYAEYDPDEGIVGEGVAAVPGDKNVVCYPIYSRYAATGNIMYSNGKPVVSKSAQQVYSEFIADTMEWENQWENGERSEEATEALKAKAERFASYITGAMFDNEYYLVDAQEYEGEFNELVDYRSLCARSDDFDEIMRKARYLNAVGVPANIDEEQAWFGDDLYTFEGAVRALKEDITAFRVDYEYYGDICWAVVKSGNTIKNEILNADMVANIAAAKDYIVSAFKSEIVEINQTPVTVYSYVQEHISTYYGEYTLPGDEISVLTTFCVRMLSESCDGIDHTVTVDKQNYSTARGLNQVKTAIAVFRQQALLSLDIYPDYNYNSDGEHFTVVVNP